MGEKGEFNYGGAGMLINLSSRHRPHAKKCIFVANKRLGRNVESVQDDIHGKSRPDSEIQSALNHDAGDSIRCSEFWG